MRGEHDLNGPPGQGRKLLIKLAQVTMLAPLGIAQDVGRPFGKQHVLLEGPTCA